MKYMLYRNTTKDQHYMETFDTYRIGENYLKSNQYYNKINLKPKQTLSDLFFLIFALVCTKQIQES